MSEMYLECGRAVRVDQKLEAGFVVHDILVDEAGEEYLSQDRRFVERLFSSPPRAKKDETIAQLEEKADTLRAQLVELRASVSEAEEKHKKNIRALKEYVAIETLVAAMRNEITHIVERTYGEPRLVEASKAKDFEKNERSFRLIIRRAIVPRRNPQISFEWAIGQYSDGSGGATKCSLHTSLASAAAEMEQWMNSQPRSWVPSSRFVENCHEFGIGIPQELIVRAKAKAMESARSTFEKKSEELSRAKEALAKAKQAMEPYNA
jgi:hypothetical protein